MDYGLSIVRTGQSVFSTPIKDQLFNSGRYMEKIAHVFETSNETSDKDFAHGLNYTPVIIDYRSIDGSFDNAVADSLSQVDNYEVIAVGINNVNTRGVLIYVLFQAGS